MRRWLRRLGLTLAALLLALTLASVAYNRVTDGRQRPATALYPGPFARVGGTLVAYSRWGGRGTPVVLLGGFVEPSWIWRRVGPLLGRSHRVYAIDLPPFGYTQRRGPYGVGPWAALVRGFDRRLGIVRPLLVGHSLGAAVVVRAALERPRALRGIVLLDGDALPIGGRSWLPHLLLDPWWTSAYRIVSGWDRVFRAGLRDAYGPHPPALDRAALDAWERPFRVTGTADAFRQLLERGDTGVTLADLRRVRVPRLVAWGAEDTVDSVTAGRRVAAALRSRLVLLPGSGHLSMLTDPTGVARAIESAARPTGAR